MGAGILHWGHHLEAVCVQSADHDYPPKFQIINYNESDKKNQNFDIYQCDKNLKLQTPSLGNICLTFISANNGSDIIEGDSFMAIITARHQGAI